MAKPALLALLGPVGLRVPSDRAPSARPAVSLRVYDVEIATEDFCGYHEVHRGFKEKLMAMLESVLVCKRPKHRRLRDNGKRPHRNTLYQFVSCIRYIWYVSASQHIKWFVDR